MSELTLTIDGDRGSLTDPFGLNSWQSDKAAHATRRRSMANILEVVAMLIRQGKDEAPIRDHNGKVVGHYKLTGVP